MDYTIIGSEVNLAARLEAASEVGGILLANKTYSLVKDLVFAEEAETISVKGFPRPIRTFRVLGTRDDAGAGDRVLHREQSGLTLTIDHHRMSDDDKQDAARVLREALAQLED